MRPILRHMSSASGSSKRQRSIRAKLLWASIGPTALVVLVVAAISAEALHRHMLRDAKEVLEWEARSLASWVETDIARNFQVSQAILATQTDAGGMFGKREESTALLRAILDSAPQITGVSIVYDHGVDGNDASMLPANGVDERGRFTPYWFRDWNNGNAIGFKAVTGMEESLFYRGPKENWEKRRDASTMLTEPYDYEGKLMVENMTPIIREGRFVGVVGADRALEDIQAEVDRRARDLSVDIFLVTTRGNVVVASDGTGRAYSEDPTLWRTRPLEETGLEPIRQELAQLASSPGTRELDDPGAGGESFFTAAAIPTGKWTLYMSVPSDRVLGPITASVLQTLGAGAVGVLVSVLLVFLAVRPIVARVVAAASRAQQVSSGNLDLEQLAVDQTDETGALLASLDRMADDLSTLVGQVREAGLQIDSTSQQLSAGAQRQEEVVASFGSSSTEIAAAARQITATSQELAREMDAVSARAQTAAEGARDGSARLDAMGGAMQSLNEATAGIADRLATINEKASTIGQVVVTITKVADQTNLLSVNAAIEAEKAGEYGRGFLVVAREIRRLADQTAQATVDIERMVKDMRAAVSSGVMEMDRFADQVRHHAGEVHGISARMGGVILSVEENSRSFGTVRDGMQSQATGAGQICESMEVLSSNARTTASVVTEFAAAASKLRSAVGTLRTAVAAFHLRGDR